MNKITILVNNIIVIGSTTDTQDGVIITKPHSIRPAQNGMELVPLFEAHIGQLVPEITFKNEHILTSLVAENNELLQAYLKKISGIITEEDTRPGIILG